MIICFKGECVRVRYNYCHLKPATTAVATVVGNIIASNSSEPKEVAAAAAINQQSKQEQTPGTTNTIKGQKVVKANIKNHKLKQPLEGADCKHADH